MNKPYTREQVKSLPLGYHITRTQLGVEEDGTPIFYPNRFQRNYRLTNKNKVAQFIRFRIIESKYKEQKGDTIMSSHEASINGKPETLLIVRRKIFHLKSAI